MSREEKITKVKKIISDFYGGNFQRPISTVAKEIVDALEEEEPEQFFKNEVVWSLNDGALHCATSVAPGHREKITIPELAATVGARIEGAKWWSIDADGLMEWWASEPAWFEESSSRKIEGWSNASLRERLITTIRQEPEKGEL